MSVPRSHAENPSDTFPTECEVAIRKLLDTCLPHLSGRELVNKAMCWCTDTVDSQWLICEHPEYKGLVLATGDSGHTFKMFPVVGKQVADLIENKVSQRTVGIDRECIDCGSSRQNADNYGGGALDRVMNEALAVGGLSRKIYRM